MKKLNKLHLGTSPINRIFITYAIPSIMIMLIQSTAGFIDSIFIGKYVGPKGLSSITLVMPILMLLVGLGTMIAVGGTTLAGIEKGANNTKKSNNYFNVTTLLLGITSIVATILILLFIPTLATYIGAKGVVLTYTVQYGQTISYFAIFFLLNFAFGFFLKLDAKPILVVILMLAGTLTNIFLDYYLIAYLDLGVQGAALATGISQAIPCLTMFIVIIKRSSWTFQFPTFRLNEIGQIFFNGFSELLSNFSFSLTGLIFNIVIMNRLGVTGVAAYAVALQIGGITSSIGYGFSEAGQAAISFNYGAGKFQRVRKLLKLILRTNIIAGIMAFLSAQLFGSYLATIFVKDQATIELATTILKYYSFAFLFICANISFGTYYTAINDPIRSGGITMYRSLIALLIGLAALPSLFGNDGIWYIAIFAELTTFIIGIQMIRCKPFGRTLIHN